MTDKPRASRAALSPKRIFDAAFDIIDAQGVAGLSARSLAKELNCEAMSLYHHVPNMEAVLDGVVDRLLGLCELQSPNPTRTRAQLMEMAHAFVELADRHPHVFTMSVSRRWVTPAAYALAQNSVSLFQSAGATPRAALRCARILGAYLGGAGSALAGWKLERAPLGPERRRAIDRAAPQLRRRSTIDSVQIDIKLGVRIIIDALLASAALVDPVKTQAGFSDHAPSD